MLDSLFVQFIKDFGSGGLIDLAPINVGIGVGADIFDEPLVFGRASCEFSRVDGEGIAVFGTRDLSFVVFDFVLEELFKGLILVNGGGVGDAEAGDAGRFAGIGALEGDGRVVLSAEGIVRGRRNCSDGAFPLGLIGRSKYLVDKHYSMGDKSSVNYLHTQLIHTIDLIKDIMVDPHGMKLKRLTLGEVTLPPTFDPANVDAQGAARATRALRAVLPPMPVAVRNMILLDAASMIVDQ